MPGREQGGTEDDALVDHAGIEHKWLKYEDSVNGV